jgi:Type IV secretion system pilin
MNPTPTGPWDSCSVDGVATFNCIPLVFDLLIRAALVFAGVVALFFIIWAGFNITNSGGDPKKVDSAKRILTYAIIGLVIILFSFGIIYFIGYITDSSACITSFADPAKWGKSC